jgi:hypothetical protein
LFGIEMGEERMQGVESGGKVPRSSLPVGDVCELLDRGPVCEFHGWICV